MPLACSDLRSVISGLVSFPLIPAIILDRVAWSTISVTILLASLGAHAIHMIAKVQ